MDTLTAPLIAAQANTQMTAAVLHGSEDLKIESVGIPRLAPDEALVRVKVALTCGTDLKVWKRGYHARMITPPAIFGHELAGIIEQVGSDVPRSLQVGTRVVPSNSAPCGVCLFCRKQRSNLCEDLLFNNGAYAEYIRIPGRIVRQNLLEIPPHVSYLDAAMAEPLACVLRGIDDTGIQPGDTTVLIGCGPIGLKFIRILAGRGVNVIALGKRPNQIQSAERMGARAAFDVSKLSDPVSVVRRMTEGGRGADSVIEAVGSPQTWEWAHPDGALRRHRESVRRLPARAARCSSIRTRCTTPRSPSSPHSITRRALFARRWMPSRAAKFVPRISSTRKSRCASFR